MIYRCINHIFGYCKNHENTHDVITGEFTQYIKGEPFTQDIHAMTCDLPYASCPYFVTQFTVDERQLNTAQV